MCLHHGMALNRMEINLIILRTRATISYTKAFINVIILKSLLPLKIHLKIWSSLFTFGLKFENRLLFYEVVSGSVLYQGVKVPPSGVCELVEYYLEGPKFMMTLITC